ncbi:PEBP-like protein [Lindgomyces ingoldianus]|uniref:PEBP-like protein n=1 Tax=Lindgomyces ingoldianus TaxID=673940 RepID=A0ACB6QKN6_9PLEO|nr:PEBP-like protein [Lindgomyces ingoldianus]KAF2466701.1 PEBP-like protein [Lindgomyces ingoldianus]
MVLAQTAPGFPVQAQRSLQVTYGSNNISPAGELIPRPEVANPPTISTPAFTSTGKAILFMVDSDVPRNGTRVQLLHWLVSNVTLSAQNSSVLDIPTPGEAPYRQPSPPVGDIPHAYTFVLFSQPENFSIPAQFNDVLQTRVLFDISAFIAATGLQDPIAANYIQVQNVTGVSGTVTTFPPARPTTTPTSSGNSSTVPIPGSAPPAVLGGGKFLWAGVGTAVIAGVAAFSL